MNNKAILGVVAVLVGASFYGGMVYGKSTVQQTQGNRRVFQGGNFQGGNFQGGMGGGNGGGRGGNAVVGDILSKGQNTLTVKMRDGGSKIVIFTASTTVRAIQDISPDTLTVGKSVIINGAQNSDGSVTAQAIQVRDASSTPFGPGFNRPPQQ
jgi:hypothetical protein